MSQESTLDDSRTQRVSELREFIFNLNDAIAQRLGQLGIVQDSIVERVLSGQMSMIAERVPAHKLADRVLARSLRLNVRIYQRNLIFFMMRRRFAEPELESLGLSLEGLDEEWRQVRREEAMEKAGQLGADESGDQASLDEHAEGIADASSAAGDLLAEALAEAGHDPDEIAESAGEETLEVS